LQTIRLFIGGLSARQFNGCLPRREEEKVIYQRVKQEMRLASDNSWAWRRLKHLSWRLRWTILCTLELRMAVSCKISRAHQCFIGLSSWLNMTYRRSPIVTRWTRSTAALLPDNCTRLADSLQQTVDAFKFLTLVGKFTQQRLSTKPLW